jgi:hypothetical protein
MRPNLPLIIGDLAERADDYLAGAADRKQGRAGIEEALTIDYPGLAAADRAAVVQAVMAILEEEDFFGTEYVGDAFAEEPEPEE